MIRNPEIFRRLRAVLAVPVLLALAAAAPAAHHYRLDPASSDVSASVSFFALAHKKAGFPKMMGSITLVPDQPETIDLNVTLDATALTAGDSVTLKRLKGPKFFDVAHHPTIRFSGQHMELSGKRTAMVTGKLTARGVTRPATLKVTFDRPPLQARADQPIGFTATTTIDRRDYGMTAYSLIVGRDVDITIKARMLPGGGS